ncbi:MAG: haloacid dehalogenase-like hydrolase [Polyangiaceae bacterium]
MPFEMVVFDVAGTTVRDDGAVATCLRDTVTRRGAAPTAAAISRVMGLAKPVALKELLCVDSDREPTRSEIAHAHDEFERRMVRHYAVGAAIEPIPGAAGAFRALRAHGVRVVLDTGFSRRILDAVLHRLGWRSGASSISPSRATRSRAAAPIRT